MNKCLIVCVCLSLLAGCFGQPGSREEEALGDVDHFPTGPEHRPGQPCLVCHGEEYRPGDEHFLIAGTVYETPESEHGLEGVNIELRGAGGELTVLRSNQAGNFFLEADDGAVLHYPLQVAVVFGERVVMHSPIEREGSCAHCHSKDGPHESSTGRIYVSFE